jgi:hypothetical protein
MKRKSLEKLIEISKKFQKKFGSDYYTERVYVWAKEFEKKYNHSKMTVTNYMEKQMVFFYKCMRRELK